MKLKLLSSRRYLRAFISVPCFLPVNHALNDKKVGICHSHFTNIIRCQYLTTLTRIVTFGVKYLISRHMSKKFCKELLCGFPVQEQTVRFMKSVEIRKNESIIFSFTTFYYNSPVLIIT